MSILNIFLSLLADDTTTTDTPAGTDWTSILLIVGVVVILGGLMVYSSFKKRKYQSSTMEMMSKLAVGDKVMTAGGIVGEIVEINQEEGLITVFTGDSNIVFEKQRVYAFGFFDKPKPNQPNNQNQQDIQQQNIQQENIGDSNIENQDKSDLI